MPQRPTPTGLTLRPLPLALLSVMLAMPLVASLPAHAAEPSPATTEQQQSYRIPAGTLEDSLNALGRQAGIVLMFSSDLVGGKNSGGLSGHFTPGQALERLLSGTGLVATPQSGGGYSIAPEEQGTTTLPAVKVVAGHIRDATTEDTGSYTSNQVTIGKREQSLREIPQSVSVTPRKRMNDQNMTTLDDVLTQATGITRRNFGPTASTFRSRGYDIDTLLLDGSPVQGAIGVTDTMFDTAVLDRVEVLRGPAGLLQGSGEPSGTVNLARKRAREEFGFEPALTYGSWDTYRGEVDVTGALDESGKLRGRLVAVHDDRNHFKDHVYIDKTIGYGTVEYDFTPNTTVSVGIMDQSGESRPDMGLPQLADGQLLDIDHSKFHGSLWDVKDESIERHFAELEHQFDNGGNLRLIADHIERETDAQQSSASVTFPVSNADELTVWQWRTVDPREDSFIDATFSTPFDLFGNTHDVMIGANHRVIKDQFSWGSGDPQHIQRNLANPDPNTPKPTFDINETTNTRTEETGFYSQLRLSILDNTTFIAGGRVSRWQTEDRLDPSNNFEIDSEFTPYASLIYDINSQISTYSSYSEIFKPQTSQAVNGDFLEPRTGEQFELGLKGEHLNGAVNWHTAVFHITDQNRAIADLNNPGFSIAEGEVESEGFEMEVTGRPSPRWDIVAGYAYTQTEFVNDPVQEGRTFSTDTPEHDLKLWTRYRFSGNPDLGWRVGAGLNYVSNIFAESDDARWEQGGYTILSGLIGYRFNRNLDFSLTGNNLTGKKYFSTLRARTRNNYYGEPRNFMLTMRYQY